MSIPGLAFGFVGARASRKRAVRGVVAGDMSRSIATRRGTFELLRMWLELAAVGARASRQAVHIQTAYNGVARSRIVAYFDKDINMDFRTSAHQ